MSLSPANGSDTSEYLDLNKEIYEFIYYDGELEQLKSSGTEEKHFIPMVTIYGLAFLTGVLGNTFVIFAVVGDKKARSVTTSFMVSLAVADILFLSVCVPYQAVGYVAGQWALGSILCKLSGFIEMLTTVSSILNLSSISIERFIVIVMPMRSLRWCTAGNTHKMIIVIWGVSMLLSSPTLYVMDTVNSTFYNNSTSVTISMCSDMDIESTGNIAFAIFKLLILFVIPTIVMVVCYTGVIYALWISSRELTKLATLSDPSNISTERLCLRHTPPTCAITGSPYHFRKHHIRTGPNANSVDVLQARKQVIKMLIAVVLVFLLCWGPKISFDVTTKLSLHDVQSPEAFYSRIVIDCLPYIQSCLNPFIYCFMSQKFRRSLLTSFQRHCRVCLVSKCCKEKSSVPTFELVSNGSTHTKLSLRISKVDSNDDIPCAAMSNKCRS